ncbi:MAG: hypothetical protein HYV60_05135, partial [Planctomycetia bacterium]|nr:hypothetical protein [Planctomycetia bacterium]
MSKPKSFWSWDSLRSWILGGGRKRGKKRFRRTRTIRMEPLNPRIVLAADAILREDAIALDQPAIEEVSVESTTIHTSELNTQVTLTESVELSSPTVGAVIGGNADESAAIAKVPSNADQARAIRARYDVNRDGDVSPIDVLVLVNHV